MRSHPTTERPGARGASRGLDGLFDDDEVSMAITRESFERARSAQQVPSKPTPPTPPPVRRPLTFEEIEARIGHNPSVQKAIAELKALGLDEAAVARLLVGDLDHTDRGEKAPGDRSRGHAAKSGLGDRIITYLADHGGGITDDEGRCSARLATDLGVPSAHVAASLGYLERRGRLTRHTETGKKTGTYSIELLDEVSRG